MFEIGLLLLLYQADKYLRIRFTEQQKVQK